MTLKGNVTHYRNKQLFVRFGFQSHMQSTVRCIMIWWAQGHTSCPAGLHTYKSCLFQVSGQRGKIFLSQPALRMNITRMLTVCTSPLYISKRYRIFNLVPAVQYTLVRATLFRLFFNAETQCGLNGAPVQSLWPQNTSPLFPANCITLLSSSLGS